MNYIKISFKAVILLLMICFLIVSEFSLVLLTIKISTNIFTLPFQFYSFPNFWLRFKGNPSCTFLRAIRFFSIICRHDISRLTKWLFKTNVSYMSGDGSKPLSVNQNGWRHLALLPTYRSRAGLCGYLELLRQGYSFHQILH